MSDPLTKEELHQRLFAIFYPKGSKFTYAKEARIKEAIGVFEAYKDSACRGLLDELETTIKGLTPQKIGKENHENSGHLWWILPKF